MVMQNKSPTSVVLERQIMYFRNILLHPGATRIKGRKSAIYLTVVTDNTGSQNLNYTKTKVLCISLCFV